jgi:glutaredoxin 3
MATVVMYTTPWCPYCIRARGLLDNKGVVYTDINVSGTASLRDEMERKSGRHTVPQIWINDQHVGGCNELMALERAGKLDDMLRS